MSFRPGDVIEHFVILSPLGEGGMGQVYVARDERLQRSVALKIVHPGDGASERATGSEGAARLLREAQSAAALEHPNVVTIYEVGEIQSANEERGRPYIAMELVKGRSLRAFVGDASVPCERRVAWLADVARALAAAHKAGLVHRDIKPENVMVRDDGVVKVLDFGVAKRAVMPSTSSTTSTEAQVLPSLTAKGLAVGTPYYMAPEQMRREPLDGRADQFAWAVMAYELLSGVPAWGRGLDALELVSKILSDEPPPLEEVAPSVPTHVVAVVKRAMAKKRGERFASMDDLVHALTASESIEASGGTPVPSHGWRSRPNPATLPRRRGVALVALGGATVVGLLSWLGGSRRASLAPRASDSGAVAVRSCLRNSDCADAGTRSACVAGSCSASRGCASSAECRARAGGAPSICHVEDGTCAPLETPSCRVNADAAALDDDATLWIGTLFPHVGPDAADFGDDNARGVVLARDDFRSVLGGIPLPGARPRPIGIVECDDAVDPLVAAKHLALDVRVPAVIGFHLSKEAVDLANEVFIPNHVLAVAAPNRSAFLSSIPNAPGEPSLVWRTTPDPAQWAAPVAALVSDHLEPELRASRAVDDLHPLRLALMRPKNDTGLTLSYALMRALRFNGKTAAENEALFREVLLDDDEPDRDFADVANDLLAFLPNVVIYSTSGDTRVIESLERQWPRGRPRPRYVSVVDFRDDAFFALLRRSPDLRRRVLDVHPVMATIANLQLSTHFDDVFNLKYSIADAPSASYDAAYLVFYAACAANDRPLSGLALARAVDRLQPPGPNIDVGPARILDAIAALRAGHDIDLNGTGSRLDYSPGSAAPTTDFAVYCVGTETGGEGRRESGLRFDSGSGQFHGTLACSSK